MKVPTYISKLKTRWLLLWMVGILAASCDTIYEDEGDCTTYFRVKFTYDMNMSFADAFAHNVKSVTLYIFDGEGRLIDKQSESGSVLAEDDYVMNLGIEPGTYTLVAWAEGWETGSTFTYPMMQPNMHSLHNLTCRMNREYDEGNAAYIDNDLTPLFHGIAQNIELEELLDGGEQIIPINLTKNTHNVRVMLQHLSGEDIHADDFTYTITDVNGHMNYDNSLLDDETLTYRAWTTYEGTASLASLDGTRDTQTSVSVAIAELTTGRLMADQEPALTVRNEKGETVLSIPLVDYALLVKGHYNRNMSDQEYLDRQSEYNLTFFLDEDNRWVNSSIIINSWHVVLQETEL